MKKKIIIIVSIVVVIGLISILSCVFLKDNKKDNENALAFKEEYESLNGVENHRTLNISIDNPYIKVSQEKIVEKIENGDTFYLYVGDSLCPWCRSVIEKSIEVAKDNKIDEIYYIDIWDDDHNEILRDKYEIVDGEVTKTQDGTKEYYKLLNAFDSVLRDYTLTDTDGNTVEVGEKRIYAPNFFYIKNGKVVRLVTGISDKQENPREELTEEILKDEEDSFNELFIDICDDAC